MTDPVLVVLVEDTEADVRAARRMLHRLDPSLDVRHFPTGEHLVQALERDELAGTWPRLFILDVNLGGMTGLELLRWLKASPWHRVPVVVLSGSAHESDVQRCYDSGAAGYITKPFGAEQLVSVWASIFDYWIVHAAPTTP